MKNFPEQDLVPLRYWRAALAEVGLCHPEVPADDKPIAIGAQNDGRWQVTAAQPTVGDWVAAQFSASKVGTNKADGKPAKTISFVLIAARLSAQASHGVKVEAADINQGSSLCCIPCLLDRQGALLPDPDRHPWIPRDMLAPSLKPACIGELDRYDTFLSTIPGKPTSLDDTMQTAARLFLDVTGTTLPLLAPHLAQESAAPVFDVDGYQVVSAWHGLPYNPPIIARHIIKLYDQLIDDTKNNFKTPATPLLGSLRDSSNRQARAPLALTDYAAYCAPAVGHIDREHALSPSQREAVIELTALPVGEVLAVNGPPGTGKTTLLHSIIAQLWVDAALQQAACPLIVITSTNVKAVENVLEIFSKIAVKINHQRWINYKGGFGLFMVSALRETKFPACTSDTHPFTDLETAEAIAAACEQYLVYAAAHFGQPQDSIAAVVEVLHAELTSLRDNLQSIATARYGIFTETSDTVLGALTLCQRLKTQRESDAANAQAVMESAERLITQHLEQGKTVEAKYTAAKAEIDNVERAWSDYLATSPIWLDLLSFLPPIRQRRNARDRAFLLSQPFTDNFKHRDDDLAAHFDGLRRQALTDRQAEMALINTASAHAETQKTAATAQLNAARSTLARVNALLKKWSDALGTRYQHLVDVSFSGLHDGLDTAIRAPMFALADRYWTGMWLLEMQERLSKQLTDTKGRTKLEAKYRRFAKLSPCMVSNFHMAPSFFTAWQGEDIPMWNTIDLLIVDEAGQVSPDIGAAMFALAKRAVVVGDSYQIEPVWNTGETTDRSNALKFGLTTATADLHYDQLAIAGYTAARGNLMKIAGRACAVQKYDDVRGLMLTEHRRCVPELVAYCNSLVYAGRLQPLRPALDAAKRLLPAFHTINVQGCDKIVGSSRQNQEEAAAIVAWLVENRSRIQNHYRDKDGAPIPIWKLLGIVTPFSPQASLIEALLRKSLPDLADKNTRLVVGTVHALQGQERDIVIFSPTYGQGHSGGMFFDKTPNMLNVAVSRAKDSFVVIGNHALFNPAKRGTPSGLLANYLADAN